MPRRMSVFTTDLGRKRLELLNTLVPHASTFGLLINPKYQGSTADAGTVELAAKALSKTLRVLPASDDAELEATLNGVRTSGVDAILVDADALFVSRRERVVTAMEEQRVPAIFDVREFVTAGGLMSYGTSLSEAYRQVGITTGRILRGEAPASLPVQQAVKFEMVINQRTAAALGLTIPPTLLARPIFRRGSWSEKPVWKMGVIGHMD